MRWIQQVRQRIAQNLSTQRTPAQNLTELVTGEVDNGRRRRSRTARRSRIDIDGDRLAELLHRLLAGDRSGPPGEICAADGERTGSAEYLSRSEEHTSELQSHSDLVC